MATGRRKTAIAVVKLMPGKGEILIDGRAFEDYFCKRPVLVKQVTLPFVTVGVLGQYDVFVKVRGGGIPAQATAVSMGIARALLIVDPAFRIPLKKMGLLRRDPRMKERKKYGHKKARKSFQFSKR